MSIKLPHLIPRPLAALAVVAAVAAAGPVAAQPSPTTSTSHPAHLGVRIHSRPAAVRAYWTRARMQAAIPLDAIIGSRTARATAPRTQQTGAGGVVVPRTVGKLFFSDSSADYVCTAAAIVSRSRNQILTAGHCVHTGPHPEGGGLLGLLPGPPHYFSHWMYVPRYNNGKAPLGKWVATHAYVTAGWRNDENFSQDQGVLTLAKHNGRKLVAVTGGNRIRVGASPVQRGVRVWGYPAESPYNGQRAWRCDGSTRSTSVDWPHDSEISCAMNGGASGGPWLLRAGRTAQAGTIYAVTSRQSTAGPKVLLAHPLTKSVRWLIGRADH